MEKGFHGTKERRLRVGGLCINLQFGASGQITLEASKIDDGIRCSHALLGILPCEAWDKHHAWGYSEASA